VIENRDNPRAIRKPGDNGEKDFLYPTVLFYPSSGSWSFLLSLGKEKFFETP